MVPGRSVFDKLKAGTARRIKKDGPGVQPHPCRGHRLRARSLDRAAAAGAIYNVADDEPAAPDEVVAYAAS